MSLPFLATRRWSVFALILGTVVFLSSCLGGGGGSGSGSPPSVLPYSFDSGPTMISDAATDAWDHEIAVDGNGKATVAWLHFYYDGGLSMTGVSANRYEGGGWKGFSRISGGDKPVVGPWPFADCRLAMDPMGNAFVVWQQFDAGMVPRVYGNRYDNASGAWAGAARISDLAGADDSAIYPSVAVDSSGNAIVLFAHYFPALYPDVPYSEYFARRYSAGSWAPSVTIGTGSYYPQMAFDGAGNGIVTWDGDTLTATRYLAAGNSWGGTVTIGNAAHGILNELAVNPSGEGVAAWLRGGGYPFQFVEANRYDPVSGRWGTPTVLSGGIDDVINCAPQASVDPDGNAFVVWQQGKIYASRYAAGTGAWEEPSVISGGDSVRDTSNAYPRIAADADGNAVVVWNEPDGIRMNRYSSASRSWESPVLLRAGADEARVASDGTGSFIAVWSQQEGSRKTLWAAWFR